MRPSRHLAPLAAMVAVALGGSPAEALNTAPLNPTPLHQIKIKPADARARIAATRAGVQARNATVMQNSVRQPDVSYVAPPGGGCIGAVGSVIAPQNLRSGRLTAITNVQVNTVNVFC